MTDSWGERHQSALYLTSMAVGVVLSLFCPPEVSEVSDALVPYALAVLLFVNFMGVPFGRGQERERNGAPAAASRGFILWLITLNFIVVPLLVMILLPTFLGDISVIALAVALVVLAPCIDYVVVFTRYAGGDSTLLLRKTPLLLGLQILIIPIWTSIYTYIGIFAYKDLGSIFPLPASAYAALLVVMIPALAAYLVQRAHHTPKIAKYAKTISDISETYMVGIMWDYVRTPNAHVHCLRTPHRRSTPASCSLGAVLLHLRTLRGDARVLTPVYGTVRGEKPKTAHTQRTQSDYLLGRHTQRSCHVSSHTSALGAAQRTTRATGRPHAACSTDPDNGGAHRHDHTRADSAAPARRASRGASERVKAKKTWRTYPIQDTAPPRLYVI